MAEYKYDIFVSYSRKDKTLVEEFVNRLKVAIPKLEVWFDLTGIESGDEFDEKIITAIDNSFALLFFHSENSIKSQWTKDEVMYAKNTEKKVVPVLLDGTKLKGWFLFKFGRIDYVDPSSEESVLKFLNNLSSWVGKPLSANVGATPERKVAEPKEVKNRPEGGVSSKSVVELPKRQVSKPVEKKIESNSINGYDYVDLGLPSGLKWATCNVGASSPEEYGDYYAWGEVETKRSYSLDNSKTYGKSMSDISGNPSYDVARKKWGSSWRLPTMDEFEELQYKCKWKRITQGSKECYKVIGPNGNSIFLPAAGFCCGSKLYDAGKFGYYWSSSPHESYNNYAYYSYFLSSYFRGKSIYSYYGHSVRPVSE